MKSRHRSIGTGGDGAEEDLERAKEEKTMMGMMGGINMVVYLPLNRRMNVLIAINGELFASETPRQADV
jgi:hypothetical protein